MGVEGGAIEQLNATLFAYISKAEMEEQFEHGNATASPGPDGIPTSMWNSNDDARRVTLRLLNLAPVYGSAPRSWTEGHQIIVPKSDSSCSPGDFRSRCRIRCTSCTRGYWRDVSRSTRAITTTFSSRAFKRGSSTWQVVRNT
eukprot:GHVU01096466.1.p1 GENE.GHVU01096466.1~~GHVU01096466.1.p1  ORF type:complete len:143 (-),score=5.16 GHVU01096466.1:158-586(-)